MEYTKLGNTDITISKLCLGCMSFGDRASQMHAWTLNLQDSEAIIKHALDLGINFFDTANCYSAGTSEEYLGRAIKRNAARDKVVLASKVYFNDGHLSKEAIQREMTAPCAASARSILILYIIHRLRITVTPMEETMEALDSLVKAGKVRALGASAMYGYQFYNMQLAAERNGWTPFSSMQNHYSLLYREDERELIPICSQMNVSLTSYSPLAAGRLARPEWKADTLRSQTDKVAVEKYDSTQVMDSRIVKQVQDIAAEHGATMTQIALAWQFAKGVASPIIGATKMSYLDDAAGAFDVTLTEDDMARLEQFYLPHKVVGASTKASRRRRCWRPTLGRKGGGWHGPAGIFEMDRSRALTLFLSGCGNILTRAESASGIVGGGKPMNIVVVTGSLIERERRMY